MNLLGELHKYSSCTHDTLLYIRQHPEAKAILHLAMRDGRNSLFTKNCPTRPEILRGSDVLFRWCDAIKNLGIGKRAREKFRDEATATVVKNALQILVTELWCPMSASTDQLRMALNGGYRNGKGVLTSALKQARYVISELREDLRAPYPEVRVPHPSPQIIKLPELTSIPCVKKEEHDIPVFKSIPLGNDESNLCTSIDNGHAISRQTLPPDFTSWTRLELGAHKELTPVSTPFMIHSPPIYSLLAPSSYTTSPLEVGINLNQTTISTPTPPQPQPSLSVNENHKDHATTSNQYSSASLSSAAHPPSSSSLSSSSAPQGHSATSPTHLQDLKTMMKIQKFEEFSEEKDIATLLLSMKEQQPLPSSSNTAPHGHGQGHFYSNSNLSSLSSSSSSSSPSPSLSSSLESTLHRMRSHSRTSSFGGVGTGKNKRDDGTETDLNETEDDGDGDGDHETKINNSYVTCGSSPYLLESQHSDNEIYESFISMLIHAGYATHLLTDTNKLDEWMSQIIFLMNYELVAEETSVLHHRHNLAILTEKKHLFRLISSYYSPSSPSLSSSSSSLCSSSSSSSSAASPHDSHHHQQHQHHHQHQSYLRICYGNYDAHDILFSRTLAEKIIKKLRKCGEILSYQDEGQGPGQGQGLGQKEEKGVHENEMELLLPTNKRVKKM